ncbi:glycosyltransferase [Pyrobaculum sp.]|uniref:glycosyltransferase n=1 Tax=Pyrobaculum sp. TaxID=2004705 RepID=UPI003173007D
MKIALISDLDPSRGGGARRAQFALVIYRLRGIEAKPTPPITRNIVVTCDVDAYLSYHENFESLTKALVGGLACGVPKIALLQGIPFYRDVNRRRNILRALSLFEKYGGSYGAAYLALRRAVVLRPPSIFGKVLRLFNGVIHVSRAIPEETGIPGIVLDPGVSLPKKEIELAMKMRAKANRRDIIYVGRPVPEKGVIEAVLAYAHIAQKTTHRLIIIAPRHFGVKAALKAAKKLGISHKVFHKTPQSRLDLLQAYATSKALVYPSHDDSYSLIVYEALLTSTPVVAYDIPALRLNFAQRGATGLTLISEGDYIQLGEALLQALEKNTDTTPPHTTPLEKILTQEAEIIKALAKKNIITNTANPYNTRNSNLEIERININQQQGDT